MSFLPLEFGIAPSGYTGLAATGTSQVDALPLPSQINQFSTVANNSGCVLPRVNATITVINNGVGTLIVYPSKGGQIDNGSVDAGFSVASGSQITLTCTDNLVFGGAHTWRSIGVPSTFNGGTVTGATTFNNTASFNNLVNQTFSSGDHPSDLQFNSFINTTTYTSDASTGANLGVASTLRVDAGGHTYNATHSSAIYGSGVALGSSPSLVDTISGIQGASGNAGSGTVNNTIAVRAHASFNTGGGTVVNDYAFYHDPAPVGTATHQYGFYIARPSGMGIIAPLFNLDMICFSSGMNATQGLRISFSAGVANFTVTNTGLGLGTLAATAQIDVRGSDDLVGTRLLKLRNTSGDILDVRSNGAIGFNGATAVTKPTVSGSRSANAALASLLTALANYGLLTDSTTA